MEAHLLTLVRHLSRQEFSPVVILPEGADWIEATAELRRAYISHPEVDPAIAGSGAG